MSWQLFWFLHTCVVCIDVQLILEQRYNFFMNEQKGGVFSLLQDKIWFGLSSICDIMSFPIPSFAPFLCSSAKVVHQPWKLKGRAASRFGQNLPPTESIHPENLSPFNVCTQKCRRQRKWTTDENVEKYKLTAYKRILTLITLLYAVLVSIHRGTIILQ